MRSKTSFFNKTLFWKTVRRFWPLWCAYALCWTAALPLPVGGDLSRYIPRGEDFLSNVFYALHAQPLNSAGAIAAVFTGIMGCASAMAVYSYLYSHRSVSAYAMLPVRRECVFTTVTLAGLLPVLAVNVLVFLITLLTEAAFGAVYVPALLSWLGAVTLMYLFFFGFAAFCAQLTGNLVVLPLLYLVLNFTGYVVVFIIGSLFSEFIYGYSGSMPESLVYLSPLVAMINKCGTQPRYAYSSFGGAESAEVSLYFYQGWILVGVCAAVGAAMLICALLINRRRRMETAGDVVSVGWLRPVFKYCLALGCALCVGAMLYSLSYTGSVKGALSMALLILYMTVGCFIGYFAAQMLTGKTFAVFRGGKNWLGFVIACALIAGLSFSWELDLWGFERRLPDEDDVASVTVSTNGDSVTLKSRENIAAAIALHGGVIENKDYHERQEGRYQSWLQLSYALSNGKVLVRTYGVYSDGEGDLRALQDLINTDEAVAYRKSTPVPITKDNIYYAYVQYSVPDDNEGIRSETLELTGEEAAELYNDCIVPDTSAGGLGRIWLITDEDYYSRVYNATIEISYYEPGVEKESSVRADYYFSTTPTTGASLTDAWLQSHGAELHLQGEFADDGAVYPTASAVYSK